MNDFRCNKNISETLRDRLLKALNPGEKPSFALVSDLCTNAQYGTAVMLITDSRILLMEEDSTEKGIFVSMKELESARVKRLYGSAVFYINEKIVMRSTFAVVSMMEAVADFLNKVVEGEKIESITEQVFAAMDKLQCTCPQCGRTLLHPGAQCVYCMGKGKLLSKIFKYLMPHKRLLVLTIIMAVISTMASLVPPYITKTLVDDVLPNKNLTGLVTVVACLASVYIVQHIASFFNGYWTRILSDNFITDMRNDIYRKAQFLPVLFYDKTSTGSIISRISTDTQVLNSFSLNVVKNALIQAFTAVGIIFVMASMNLKLTLLSLAPIPIIAIGSRIFRIKIRPIYRKTWQRWSAVSSMLSDTLPAIRVIKSFTGEKRMTDKFERFNREWFNTDKKAALAANLYPHVIGLLVCCGTMTIWAVGGIDVINHPELTSIGLLVSFISYAGMFYGPVNFFANLSDSYQQAITSAERLFDILDAEPEHNFHPENKMEHMEGRIEFRHVTFSFDKTVKTLDDINLVIEPGDIVGIVGTTGSGKSTLINLFMRFYDNYEGQILVDGKDIRDIDLDSYRSHIGFVQQESLMFRDSIFNNIAFSRPDATVESVIHAADIANAHGFIAKMPDAYDTILGERGSGLSGGERQRLSIARAVLMNPSVLVFDEATAAVDSETEHLIQEAIERLICGRTTLMIAHRLSTLRKANKIIVVDKGRIIECGTQEELMALGGKYSKLVHIQNMSEEARRVSEEESFS